MKDGKGASLKRWLWLLLLSRVCLAEPVSGGPIDEVRKVYGQSTGITGEYTQIKKVVRLPLTLRSQGRFSLSDNSVTWQQMAPLSGRYQVGTRELKQTFGDSSTEDFPWWQISHTMKFSQFLVCLLRGQITCLRESFTIETVRSGEDQSRWRLKLLPKNEFYTRTMTTIAVEGRLQDIDKIEIKQKNDNSIVFRFTNIAGEK